MSADSGYPSDLPDERWALIEPVLSAWRAERRGRGLDIGRPPEHDLHLLMNAVLYVDRTGVPWRYLPHDFPPWPRTYHYFACWQQAHHRADRDALRLRRAPRANREVAQVTATFSGGRIGSRARASAVGSCPTPLRHLVVRTTMNFSTSLPTGAVVRLGDVRQAYGRCPVLLGTIGANGADKSTTLLRIVEAAADSGTVLYRGRMVYYCPQNSVLHPAVTVQEHVHYSNPRRSGRTAGSAPLEGSRT